ncbi:signal transduction histidine kinase [[Synechococcus] sp. NIES-970]|nr:signal transduction histidine kinase [[Synechococcus] sp. NIES-970]
MGCSSPKLSSDLQCHLAYWQPLNAEILWIQDQTGTCIDFYGQQKIIRDSDRQRIIGEQVFTQWFDVAPHPYANALQQTTQGSPATLEGTFRWEDKAITLKLLLMPLPGSQLLVIGLPRATHNPVLPLSPLAHQKALTQIARKIRSTLDWVVIRQEAVNGIGETLQVSRCLLLATDEMQQSLRVEAEYRQPEMSSCLGIQWRSPNNLIFEQLAQTKEPQQTDVFHAVLPDSQSILIVPTLYQGSVNGLICLQQCNYPREWQEVEQEFAQEIAEQLGTAIAHATLYKELEHLHQTATEATRLKNDFLASTTHELRTPLNGIIGFLKLILDEMADDRTEELEFVGAAYESALHLLNLINDILDIAKIEAGKIDLEFQPIKLTELLDNLNNFARPQLQTKQLTWDIHIPESHDDIILYTDYRRIFQVLLNLVSNAIKFTPNGGITIDVELVFKPITYGDRQFPGVAKISVIDTGIGVALDMQTKLFENFSQVRGGHTRQYGGTGLGLAISKKLVEACGGKISFYSMGEGLGSTVTFSALLHQKPILKQSHHLDSQSIISTAESPANRYNGL